MSRFATRVTHATAAHRSGRSAWLTTATTRPATPAASERPGAARLGQAPTAGSRTHQQGGLRGSDTDLSLQRQEAAIRDYLANHPQWRVLGVYRDAGLSAFRRPGLQQMLAAATTGRFDALVVHRVDRLTRRSEDLDTILRTLRGASVTLHSATEPLDTSTHHGKLVASIIGALAEFARVEPDAFLPPMKRRLHRHRSRGHGRRSGD